MRQAVEILTVFVALVPLLILAKRAHVAYPIVLVLGGVVIGFIPGMPTVQFDPDFILVVFLPPLLYWAALTAPVQEIARHVRSIGLLAVVLVFVTIAAVAAIGHAALGLSWPVAIVLGAIVAPTDEVAAAAIAEDLGVSRWIVAMIEGESLLNDAAALVTYRIAIAAVVVGMPSLSEGLERFVFAAAGGIGFGLVVGYVATSVRRRLTDPAIDNTMSLLTPFLAYIPADALGLSGVLATVSAGLYLARAYPTAISSRARLQVFGFWATFGFIANATIFLLLGLQLRSVLNGVAALSPVRLALDAGLVTATLIAVRFTWVFAASYRRRRPWQPVFIVAWTGMRGGISLAAAMAIPFLAGTRPFPDRDLIIFVTFVVILVTLAGQGSLLPFLIRRLGLAGTATEEQEYAEAQKLILAASFQELDALEGEHGAPPEVLAHLRAGFRFRGSKDYRRVEHMLVKARRKEIVRMRDAGLIDSAVLLRLQRQLDLDEVGLDY